VEDDLHREPVLAARRPAIAARLLTAASVVGPLLSSEAEFTCRALVPPAWSFGAVQRACGELSRSGFRSRLGSFIAASLSASQMASSPMSIASLIAWRSKDSKT
jgi:hypothetical protein